MKIVKEDKWCTVEGASEQQIQDLIEPLTFVEEDYEKPEEVNLEEAIQLTWEDHLNHFTFLQKQGDRFRFLSGLLPYIQEQYEGSLEVEDKSTFTPDPTIQLPPDYLKGITLYGYQKRAAEKALVFRRGILDIPTRGGKTEVMIAIAKYYLENIRPEGKIIFLEPDRHLMHQTYDRCLQRGLEDVGRLGDGIREVGRAVVVCIRNSLYNVVSEPDHPDFPAISQTTGLLVDEVHHLGSATMAQVPLVLESLDLLIGVSGSPFNDRAEPHSNPSDVAIIGLLHKVIFKVSARYLMENKYIAEPHVFILGYPGSFPRYFVKNYNKVYSRFLLWYTGRNSMLIDSVRLFYEHGFNCLVLTTRLDHGKFLARRIQTFSPEVLFAFGGGKVIKPYTGEIPKDLPKGWKWYKDKEDQKKGLKYIQIPGKQQDIIDSHFSRDKGAPLVCSTVFDEGVDLPQVDALVLAGGQGKSDVKNIQRPARALTRNEYSNRVFIVDFWDNRHRYLKKHSELRIKAYKENQYFIHTGGIEELKQHLIQERNLREQSVR